MATRWVRACTVEELARAGALGLALERVRVALFWRDGRAWAISDVCNHKGGPLAAGRVNGDYVMCPWHAWEYSVKTGLGPPGYEEEAVATYAVEDRAGELWVDLEPRTPRRLVPHPAHPLARKPVREAHERPRVLGISTTAMDVGNPRFSTSDHLLEHALEHAQGTLSAETQLVRLNDLAFRPCEGNYSKAARACTWPCAITERDPNDQLTPVYEGIVHWADVVVIATPIRWGAPSALYTKMVERLNCVQNQITIAKRALIDRKVAALIVTGGQDNVQAVAGQMLMFFAELGFQFPQFPFIAHSRGWDAEDMDENVRAVQASESLRAGARELVARAIQTSHDIGAHAMKLEPGGRKAQADRSNSPEAGRASAPDLSAAPKR
jgi:nitrite reductase/ring-hydroxylating ferredoxin subunit/multimeric flavodoxin WrbA